MNTDLQDPVLVSVIDELPLWSAPFGLRLLETVAMKKGIRALDIGFGLGFPFLELAMRLGDSSRVYGIDPWAAAVERTCLKKKQYGTSNAFPVIGIAEYLPFPDGSFDLLISNNGINNVLDLPRTLRECRRVCKSGAQFVFTMNLEGTMREFYDVYRSVLLDRGLTSEVDALARHIHDKRIPVSEMLQHLRKAGFSVRHVHHDSFSYRYIDGTAMFRHFFIRLAFLEPWREIAGESRSADILGEAEGRLNAIAAREGYLRLTVPFATFDCEA
jgi:arsenite methyltransferase